MLISVSEITVSAGRRAATPEHIQELAENIRRHGLLNPITVDKNHVLIAGLHRLEAVKILEWTEIECTICDLTGLQAELAQIDENYIRYALTELEQCNLMNRRKKIYEDLYPETRWGGDRKSEKIKLPKCQLDPRKSFADDTAEKLNVSPRTVYRQVQIGKDLSAEAQAILEKGMPDVSQKNLMTISQLAPDEQVDAANQLVSGEIKSASEYRSSDSPTEESEDEYPETDSDSEQQIVEDEEPGRTFEENVAYLKSSDRDFSCTTQAFLSDVSTLVKQVTQHIAWYSTPYYADILPDLTEEQLNYLRAQLDSICREADELYKRVERIVKK